MFKKRQKFFIRWTWKLKTIKLRMEMGNVSKRLTPVQGAVPSEIHQWVKNNQIKIWCRNWSLLMTYNNYNSNIGARTSFIKLKSSMHLGKFEDFLSTQKYAIEVWNLKKIQCICWKLHYKFQITWFTITMIKRKIVPLLNLVTIYHVYIFSDFWN